MQRRILLQDQDVDRLLHIFRRSIMSQVSSSVEHVTFKPDAGCSNLYNPCHLFRPPQRGGRAPWGRRWRTKYMIMRLTLKIGTLDARNVPRFRGTFILSSSGRERVHPVLVMGVSARQRSSTVTELKELPGAGVCIRLCSPCCCPMQSCSLTQLLTHALAIPMP